ncbi:hypothetical protein, conserved [Trypanosoma brucei brucei TREU927]|uniref:Exonuclease domain-containing protein n=1 Tax=Trypanosoma brucei brucei (strain 927/4 GUTat10.1) TaxID=185431 RepID=Q580Z1_TRYB2|nr:hypothetical protein, conserved [Trypanosoma brucei brucei TREU927]AAX78962.1 hypothetical protein, conserved [Trypanosoma brucei]AAZ13136.1 hypothetical protein, conserved [Trypanosoma brucei brucei TREU927]
MGRRKCSASTVKRPGGPDATTGSNEGAREAPVEGVMNAAGEPNTSEAQPLQSQEGEKDGEKGVAAAITEHFSTVEIYFQPAAEKRRGGCFYPRDIGTLLLWSVPSPVPLVEGPRVIFVKNRSKLRDVVVLYVNGWTHDEMLLGATAAPAIQNTANGAQGNKSSLKGKNGKRPREGNDEKGATQRNTVERQCSESIGRAMLCPIRQQQCWARPECGVQFAPMIVQEGNSRVERDIFWRGGKPATPVGGQHSQEGEQQSNGARAAATKGENRSSGTDSSAPRGVGALFNRALTIANGTSNTSSAQSDDKLPTPLESLKVLSSPPGGGPSLWDDRDLLLKYALSLERDKATLEALGFAVGVPDHDEPSTWESFDAVGSAADANCADKTKNSLPNVFALDCEMVLVKNNVSALARVTLVDVRASSVVVDTLVKPDEEVVDYVTRFSGIDSGMLEGVTTTLKDCQQKLKRYVTKDAFLVGHSLENDLRACKMLPNCWLLDTAHLFPHPSGLPCKNSLRYLALRYLKKSIQQGSHDSEIDACTSAELVYLKMQHGPDFGLHTRVNVLKLMEEVSVTGEASDERQGGPPTVNSPISVELNLFDDACVLSDIVPNNRGKGGVAVNAVPVRHDGDAVRKAVRCLEKRRNAPKDAGDDVAVSYALTWVQLTQTVVPKNAEVANEETPSWEELQRERVDETNRHVMQVVQAAPHNSLIVVVVAGSSNDTNKSKKCGEDAASAPAGGAAPRGACFAFVKDDNAVGPLAAWLNKGLTDNGDGAKDETNASDGLRSIPACEQQ